MCCVFARTQFVQHEVDVGKCTRYTDLQCVPVNYVVSQIIADPPSPHNAAHTHTHPVARAL
jgi:hypothetical protein